MYNGWWSSVVEWLMLSVNNGTRTSSHSKLTIKLTCWAHHSLQTTSAHCERPVWQWQFFTNVSRFESRSDLIFSQYQRFTHMNWMSYNNYTTHKVHISFDWYTHHSLHVMDKSRININKHTLKHIWRICQQGITSATHPSRFDTTFNQYHSHQLLIL